MIDILEAENRIGEYFIELGLVPLDDDGDEVVDAFALEWPLIVLSRHEAVLCTAFIYEDFRGQVVLSIEAHVADVDDDDAVRRWATARTASSFAAPRLSATSEGRLRVSAVHHLLAETVTRSAVECVVASVASAVNQWQKVLLQPEFGAETLSVVRTIDQSAPGGIDAALAELEAMVGLGSVKTLVRRLVSTQKVATLRARCGMKAVRPSPHLVFTGNPGTGKTTVARHIGRLYREIGVLSKGHVVEVDRSSLVAGYVGQTALKTKSALESASGGVLFIDEAYSLVGDSLSDYGGEAIETILTHMENNRGDVAVVVAGYPEEMGAFLESNPGLASRFDHTLEFLDYSSDELETILRGLIDEHDYRLADDAVPALRAAVRRLKRGRGFGNAREIRRLFHDVVATHSDWVVENGVVSGTQLGLLAAEHFVGASPAPALASTQSDGRVGYL